LYFLLALHHQKWYINWKKRIKNFDEAGNNE